MNYMVLGPADLILAALLVLALALAASAPAGEMEEPNAGLISVGQGVYKSYCASCHGKHDVLSASDPSAPTAVMNIPMLCGTCHQEGSPVTHTHDLAQEDVLEHYSMSIHGEGLFRQGLSVTEVCTSCHTAHHILPASNEASRLSRASLRR